MSDFAFLRLFRKNLGDRVRAVRKAKNWRQVDLAAAVRVTTPDVGRLEQGYRVRPKAVKAILAALDLPDGDEEAQGKDTDD